MKIIIHCVQWKATEEPKVFVTFGWFFILLWRVKVFTLLLVLCQQKDGFSYGCWLVFVRVHAMRLYLWVLIFGASITLRSHYFEVPLFLTGGHLVFCSTRVVFLWSCRVGMFREYKLCTNFPDCMLGCIVSFTDVKCAVTLVQFIPHPPVD
jgi:hypothetical protein